MRSHKLFGLLLLLVAVCAATLSVATADDGMLGFYVGGDDGDMLRRNVSKTPNTETVDAGTGMMKFYVPAQSSAGELIEIEYYDADEALVYTRDQAKPLFTFYIDGMEEQHALAETRSGIGFGARDVHIAMSLDDGMSWKRANVSNSAHLSSFTLSNGIEFPGDAYAGGMAIAGDKIFAAWLSRYCQGGAAAYTLVDDLGEAIYPDYFGVAGSQKSVDYSAEHPDVGEVPYGCVWSARGQLLLDDETGLYDVVWTKGERMTSGRRDPNRIEVAGVSGAGFTVVWQEDPEGLRPGTGSGPGEGWSGAIVNAKTDIWYSFVDWDTFDIVCEDPLADECVPVSLEEYAGDTQPKVATPMVLPVRVTDNGKCQASGGSGSQITPYCYMDFSGYPDVMEEIPDEPPSLPSADTTFCVDTILWETPGGSLQEVCVSDDDRVLVGRVGASRPRLGMHGYDQDADGEVDSAWVILGYEETKALGEGTLEEEDAASVDVGKNLWYDTFDMFHPNIVGHGNILNQPAKDPLTNDFFEMLNTDDDAGLDYGAYAYDFYETEIARRFSLISQDASAAGDTGTVAFTLIKQGIINQGGPADIFARRIVLPDDFDPATDNPYLFTNMVCDEWRYEPGGEEGYNPYYPEGVCLDNAINVSGTKAVSCEGVECPTLEEVYICDDVTGVCDFVIGDFTRVTEWSMCGADYGGAQTCDDSTLDDQSWENPFDISKGHRGYLDGDFVMVLYAWSPNYKQNAVGHDHYNLYVRRSFDGGVTWTTTPAGDPYDGDGTETCENYGWGTDAIDTVCTTYAAGAFEPARNVSQLIGSRETILDPRYSPTPDTILTDGTLLYPDDERDATKFFVVYETGDNTTVITGEATPLDLFYSRATEWGDTYDVVEYERDGEIEYGWDWLEHGEDESGEASIISNPAASYFYAVWNQGLEIGDEEFTDMDAWFRRIMYIDEDRMPTAAVIYTSHLVATYDAGNLTFIGSGADSDHVGGGIVAYEWESSLDGVLGTEQTLVIPVTSLTDGVHTMRFRVRDDEGNWSAQAQFRLSVGDMPYHNMMPMVVGQ